MPVVHLTDLSIRSLPEGVFFDDRKPSFGILIGRRTKTWLVVKGRRRVREKIGNYPALSLADGACFRAGERILLVQDVPA